MDDLIGGGVLVAAGDLLLFGAGAWLGRSRRPAVAQAAGAAAVLAYVCHRLILNDDLRLASFLPLSSLIVVGNGTPWLAGFLSGLAWSLIPRQGQSHGPGMTRGVRARRLLVVAGLHAVGWFALARPIWGSPPACRDAWDGEICLQTSDATCSAACAATLLRTRGIAATEREMADLCLTRDEGTLWLGLYRGLKRKTAGTPWDVAIVRGGFNALRRPGSAPAILAAGIPRDARTAAIYTERYGWSPGLWHSVLFYGFRPGERVAMADPTPGIGREEWSEEDLRILWEGTGLCLIPRSGR